MAKNKGGRPPIFKNADDLQKEIDKYLKNCPDFKIVITKKGERIDIPAPTISGLCYFLGFESRQSFYDYEERPEFSYTVKRARLFIEKEYESLLSTNAYAGAIFALKNFGWVDKTSQEVTHNAGEDIRERYLKSLENMYADKVGEQQIQSESKEVPEQKA